MSQYVKARRNGRTLYVTIPPAIRRKLQLVPGSVLVCDEHEGLVVFRKADLDGLTARARAALTARFLERRSA